MRLVTRGDADGLTCAVFLRIKEKIESIDFVHPKDMQDGKVQITNNDIIANLPYHPNCAMWFDHHASNEQTAQTVDFKGNFRLAPSAARVIYEHYRDPALDRFKALLEQTDKMDSAHLSVEDVTDPRDFILLMYTLDPRSGLGAFKDYFLKLMDWIVAKPVDEILRLPEVKERCMKLLAEQKNFSEAMKKYSRLEGNVIITDLRELKASPIGNRFLIFTLFPQGNVQVRIFNGKGGEFIVVALGKSIFNRSCLADVGKICEKHGGGGHSGAATCQIPPDKANQIIAEIVTSLS